LVVIDAILSALEHRAKSTQRIGAPCGVCPSAEAPSLILLAIANADVWLWVVIGPPDHEPGSSDA
jgi:hypothetical protein